VPAIEIVNLHKVYGRKIALHDLNLTVERGEVFGFLGPNGAGKTTTVKILLGLVRPTAGHARIFGLPANDPEARRLVGYLPENFRFQDWLTGKELLELHADLSDVPWAHRARRVAEVLRLVGLEDRATERIRNYSKGMLQRIGLAQAMIHSPSLVLLDEPTSALDPLGRREVRDLINTLSAQGTTVFLNSHMLSEVELVCDRVAIIDHGRVIHSGRLDDLVRGEPELNLTVNLVDAELLEILERFGAVLTYDSATVQLRVTDLSVASVIADIVTRSGYRLLSIAPVQHSLEDIFLNLVERGEL